MELNKAQKAKKILDWTHTLEGLLTDIDNMKAGGNVLILPQDHFYIKEGFKNIVSLELKRAQKELQQL